MTTQSNSSDSGQSTNDNGIAHSEKGSSFARLFRYSLLAFFCLQVVLGTIVIVLFIGREMGKMQEENVKEQLKAHSHRLESFIDTRLMILEDYVTMPALIAGLMHQGSSLANAVDLIESLPFLKSDARFVLQDFQGNILYSGGAVQEGTPSYTFEKLMDGRLQRGVELVPSGLSDGYCCYWKLSVPVRYQGHPEGVLTAYIPVELEAIFAEMPASVRIILKLKGNTVTSMGEVHGSSIALETFTSFPGIRLRQEVSRDTVNDRIQYLMFMMLAALVLGTALVMFVAKRMGQKLLLVPHERLEEMRDELEQEVERQTADLKMRTVQLSIEIRERREAEIEARETGNLVSALLEGINAAFIIVDPKTNKIVRSNPVVQDMFGLAPWQLSDRSCTELFTGFTDGMSELSCPDSAEKNPYTEGLVQHADGTKFPIARYLVPMEVHGEKHIGVIMLDITERKNLERRLNTAQKLESVGELASGIAHEINTPIQYVGDSIRFIEEAVEDLAEVMAVQSELVERCREDGIHKDATDRIEELEDDADIEFVIEEIPKACTRALDGTDRVAGIVRAMKNFAHPGTGEKTMVDINQALENTIMVSKNEWKYVAEVEKDFDPVPMVRCLPNDINQVLLNILVNGAQAIGAKVGNSGEKGTITLSTRATEDDLTIRISDTGTGIPEDIRGKIFDPFFTTKEVGRGTGQGLAIVHDIIVERHGGTIDIETEVGEGTTFIITLPLATD